MTSIAIIGAGLAGTALASSLSGRADIRLFEKSRGIGGRMATRYAGIFEFDHGAQYFSARTEDFQKALSPLISKGFVSEWDGKIVSLSADQRPVALERDYPIYVASPRMNALPKHFADGVDVSVRCEVSELSRQDDGGWLLRDNEGGVYGPFDWVISGAPLRQTANLLPGDVSFSDQLSAASMSGCFSVLLGFDDRPEVDWQGAKVEHSLLGWIAINSDKPGRDTSPSLIVQTTNDWADANIERDPDEVSDAITTELKALAGIDVGHAKHISLHRWRYAHTPVPVGQNFLIDEAAGLAACGDWCLGGRVEHAFTSARALADALPV
ncbi:MAG: FAD-dependent oxidoreductase [Pseudomonadota bacterium]